MIPAADEFIPLTSAATRRLLPRNAAGRLVAPATLVRWARRGVGGRRLWAVRVGRRLFTTRAALLSFQRPVGEADGAGGDAATAGGGSAPTAPTADAARGGSAGLAGSPRRAARRLADVAAARAELAARGWCS